MTRPAVSAATAAAILGALWLVSFVVTGAVSMIAQLGSAL